MKYNKIAITLIILSFLVSSGCSTVEREMLTIDKKPYESFVFTAFSESVNHKLIIKLLREIPSQITPVECEFIIANFIGDPGVCKQASFIIDNASYDLKINDSKSEISMEKGGVSYIGPYDHRYRQKPNSFDFDKTYRINGKFIIAADTRNKIKSAKEMTVKFQTYNKTITLKVKKSILDELKEY